MTTNVTYRDAGVVVPTSTTVKGAPLSNSEIDGNFKSMADSVDAKVDSVDLAAPGGAALVGADTGLTYAAGTVGAMLKSMQTSVTTLNGQIAGILDGATFTGPVSLPGNAVDNLHAVPLQQLNAAMAEIPGAVSAYSPPCVQFRNVVEVAPPNATWTDFGGGVLQASRGGWGSTGIGMTVGAPGLIKVTVSGLQMSALGIASAIIRVKKNGTYENPEVNISTSGGGAYGGDLFLIIPAALGDVIRVGFNSSAALQSIGCASIAFEYFGPTA